jgi:uncharacterized membrane protein
MKSESAHRSWPFIAPALVVGIGVAAGLRPMMALAVVSYAARRKWIRPGRSPLASHVSRHLHKRIVEFAVSEFIAEKLPFAHSRISAASTGPRLASGAICGAAIHGSLSRPVGKGALLGALGALAGAIAGHRVRERLKDEMPGFTLALIEDVFVLGGALVVCLGSRAARPLGASSSI